MLYAVEGGHQPHQPEFRTTDNTDVKRQARDKPNNRSYLLEQCVLAKVPDIREIRVNLWFLVRSPG
jgi:hypothetical protein